MRKRKFIIIGCIIFAAIFIIGNSDIFSHEGHAAGVEVKYTTADGTAEGTLAEAVNNVTEGGTITLLSDVEADTQMSLSKNMTITGGGEFSINRGSNNAAYIFGIQDGAVVSFKNITLDGGSTQELSAMRSLLMLNGGDVILGEGTTLKNNNNTIESGAGGGVTVANGILTLEKGSAVTNCSTPNGSGGAIAIVQASGKVVMNGGLIDNCEALRGGGVYINAGTFDFNGGIISNSVATYNDPNGSVPYSTTTGAGGGVYVLNGAVTMQKDALITGCSSTGNCGGGINVVNSGAKAVINGGKIEKCKAWAGGALFSYNGQISMTGGLLSQNEATTKSLGSGGGALFTSFGKIEIQDAVISDNTSASYGGAIAINYKSEVNLTRTVIRDNKGKFGGGIGAISGTFSLDDCGVTKNHATSFCGGLFGAPGADVSLSNEVKIHNNTGATQEIYRNVYLDGNEGMYDNPNLLAVTNPLTITNPLSEDSYIGISRYICPDEDNPYRIIAVPADGYTVTESDRAKFHSDDPRFIVVIHEGKIALTFRNVAKSLTVTPDYLELIADDTYQLEVKITPETADDEFEWASSDSSIAKVDQNGVVTAVSEGEAIITVRSTITGLQATATVVVKKKKEEIPPGEEPPEEAQKKDPVEGNVTDKKPTDEEREEQITVPDTADLNQINFYAAVLMIMGFVIGVITKNKYLKKDK